jgi:hypothetical protein
MNFKKITAFIKTNQLKILVVFIFILGAGIRLFDVTDEPLEFHAPRQLRSAIIARSMYYQNNPDIPKDVARIAKKEANKQGLIEPAILETFSYMTYRLIGEEVVWVGRLFSIAFWLLGGWALYALTKEISSTAGSILSLSAYFLYPFAIYATRVLMPDPMMVALSLISIWALFNWERERSVKWAVFTGLATGFAILTKSVAGIILIFPFAAFILSTAGINPKGFRNPLGLAIKNRQLWLILGLSAFPNLVYYIYGIFIDGRLAAQFEGRFFPSLYTNPALYVNWLANLDEHFGLITVVLSMVGIALLRENKIRWLLVGWWVGYIVYGFTFPYHIMTHSYYHLPLVPIIAVSLAPFGAKIAEIMGKTTQKRTNWALILAAFGILIAFNLWQVQSELKTEDYGLEKARWEEIAGILGESKNASIAALTDDYEASLKFYGMISVRHWPTSGDIEYGKLSGGKKTFEKFWEGKAGSVQFFVIADLEEYEKQDELQERLEEYPIYVEGEGYIIFDLMGGG